MNIYGYSKKGKKLKKLREVTFECSISELERIIDFLVSVNAEHKAVAGETEYCHSHYRDWEKKWIQGSPDIIVVTKFNSSS